MNTRFLATLAVVCAGSLAPIGTPAAAQSLGGYNLFSTSQDVEIGKQSAAEAEKQFSLLNDANTNRYLNRIITRLAAVAPGAKYPYEIKAVNSADINAFALPGGPMYVHTGLITAARSEAELAGVLAHEMAHVALRHGTQQASSAYIGQAGLGILGGLFGKSANTASLVNTVGGLGLNTLFLKYSRDMEYKADATGAEIMAKAGYDPVSMANFLGLLRAEQGRDPSKLEQFFSDHPATSDRETRIRTLAGKLTPTATAPVGNFANVQRRMTNIASTTTQTVGRLDTPTQTPTTNAPVVVEVVAPSSRYVRFTHSSSFISIDRPENWPAYQAPTGYTVSIAPAAGVAQSSDGLQHMVYGMIVSHYEPFATPEGRLGLAWQRKAYVPLEDRTTANAGLQDATNDLVATVIASNPYLTMVDGSTRSERIAGAPALSLELTGTSPVTGEGERVTLFTRRLGDGHIVYALAIVPARLYDQLTPAYTRMLQSMVITPNAAHRSTRVTTASNSRLPQPK